MAFLVKSIEEIEPARGLVEANSFPSHSDLGSGPSPVASQLCDPDKPPHFSKTVFTGELMMSALRAQSISTQGLYPIKIAVAAATIDLLGCTVSDVSLHWAILAFLGLAAGWVLASSPASCPQHNFATSRTPGDRGT